MRYDIDSLMHEDEKFLALSDAAQALWTLLLTGPQRRRIPGLQWAPSSWVATLSGIRRRTPQQVQAALQELLDAGMLKVDDKARVLLIPKQPFYNPTPNGNQIRGWFTEWRGIPECALKHEFVKVLRDAIEFKSGKGADDRMNAWAETFGAVRGRGAPRVLERVPPPVENSDSEEGGNPLQRVMANEGNYSRRVTPQNGQAASEKTEALNGIQPPAPITESSGSALSDSPPLSGSETTTTLREPFRKGLDLDLDLESDHRSDGDLIRRGDARGEGPARIQCPEDLWERIPETTKRTCDTALIPRPAQESLCRLFTSQYAHRATDTRSFDQWVSSAVRAIHSDWNNKAKRPKPVEAPVKRPALRRYDG